MDDRLCCPAIDFVPKTSFPQLSALPLKHSVVMDAGAVDWEYYLSWCAWAELNKGLGAQALGNLLQPRPSPGIPAPFSTGPNSAFHSSCALIPMPFALLHPKLSAGLPGLHGRVWSVFRLVILVL